MWWLFFFAALYNELDPENLYQMYYTRLLWLLSGADWCKNTLSKMWNSIWKAVDTKKLFFLDYVISNTTGISNITSGIKLKCAGPIFVHVQLQTQRCYFGDHQELSKCGASSYLKGRVLGSDDWFTLTSIKNNRKTATSKPSITWILKNCSPYVRNLKFLGPKHKQLKITITSCIFDLMKVVQ